ncbi:RluA family pseudouridine synthase [Effusibacillus dendaii]|uniref:Pseudouridine synthase n=1 Tax=Effusibacillus dendaii TaxID=2743772 RepID=A0A7I8DBT6_9BACL|nr:RluA family pseudouridine synthase [Effusibacillus dendaii]BCJ85391.1 pseudouridine synthase [Effusibacillus dendaii]
MVTGSDNKNRHTVVSSVIPDDYDGKMVKEFIRNRLQISRRFLRKIVQEQGVRVNGLPVFLTSRLRSGDLLELFHEPERSEFIRPETMPLDIVYEDADLLVLNKPAGQVVHPTKGHYEGTLANGVVDYWQRKGETARFRPLHRLDKDTTGLLLITKNQYAHHKLSQQLLAKKVRREYFAIVHGNLREEELTIRAPIRRLEGHPTARTVASDGQTAVTHVSVFERLAEGTVVRLRLETGRTHQIRVHMSHIGHPLYGDPLYGIGEPDGINRQALHAVKLCCTHPRIGTHLEWQAELPADMKMLLHLLRNGQPNLNSKGG